MKDVVIVTGANGFLGKKLVNRLKDYDYEIIAISHKFDDELKMDSKVSCVYVDDNLDSQIFKIVKGKSIKGMFLLAWEGTAGEKRANVNIQLNNVLLTVNYVRLANKINCSKLIYASSINEMETYEYLQSDLSKPSGGYIYGTAKLAAHLMAQTEAYKYNLDFVPTVITNIYGVGENSPRLVNSTIRRLIKNEHCSFTKGEQIYDFIYITDAIESLIAILNNGHAYTRYYIGSGNPQPLKNYLIEIRDIVDPNATIGLGELPFNGVSINYKQFRLKSVEEDTGYVNKIDFTTGIKLTLEYLRGLENDTKI